METLQGSNSRLQAQKSGIVITKDAYYNFQLRSTHQTHMHSAAEERDVLLMDGGSQPPIEQPATAVHRTRLVFLAAACVVGRGSNFVCVLCSFSAVYCRCLVCARGKKPNIGNGSTVSVLILNPNGASISVQS